VGGVIDVAALAVLGLAILRGLWIGIVREAFSLAALAAAIFAFRALREPVAEEIAMRTHWDPLVATAAAGGAVVIAALLFVTLVGAIVRRIVSGAGLSFVDRLGGAAIGAAEGALLVGLALFGATELLGTKDPLLAGSRAVEMFQSFTGRTDQSARRAAVERAEAARDAATARPSAPDSESAR
jgi:membrane protein required for colicin V production